MFSDDRRHELDLNVYKIGDLRRTITDCEIPLGCADASKTSIAQEKSELVQNVREPGAELLGVRKDAEKFKNDGVGGESKEGWAWAESTQD